MTDCSICKENEASEDGTDPWLVARLQTGYVRLSPNQYFKGSLFFVAERCVREVFDLEIAVRGPHLAEMAEVAAAANEVFTPLKMNIESLGNGFPTCIGGSRRGIGPIRVPGGRYGRTSTF